MFKNLLTGLLFWGILAVFASCMVGILWCVFHVRYAGIAVAIILATLIAYGTGSVLNDE